MNVGWRHWRRELWSLRNRLLVLIVVIALGAGFALTLTEAAHEIRSSYDTMYDDNQLAHLYVYLAEPSAVDADAALDRAGVHYDKAEGRLVLPANVRHGGDDWAGRLIGVPGAWPALNDVCVLQGDIEDRDYDCTPRGLDRVDGELAYLHAPFADENGIDDGDVLEVLVGGHDLAVEVLGGALNSEFIVTTAHPEFLVPDTGSLAVLWVDQDWLQHETGLDGMVTEILVRFEGDDPEAQARAVLDDWRDHPDDWDIPVQRMEVREDTFSYSLSEGDINGFLQLSGTMSIVVTIIATVTVAVSVRRIVESRRHVIGVMRSLGGSRKAIVRHYVAMAAVIGTIGGMLGAAVGRWGSGALAYWYQGILDFPFLDTTGSGGPYVVAVVLAVVASMAGAAPAAIQAARAPIASTLASAEVRSPGALTRALGRFGGPTWRMAVRNIARRPRRSIYTVVSLGLALVIAFSMLGVLASMQDSVDEQLDEREDWDGQVGLQEGTPAEEALAALRDVPGVQEAEVYLSRYVTIDDEDTPFRLVGIQARSVHGFRALDGDDTVAEGEALVARPLVLTWKKDTGDDIEVGDDITLHWAGKAHKVTVAGIVQEPLGAALYLPYDEVQALVGGDSDLADGAWIQTGPGFHERDLAAVPGLQQHTSHASLRDAMQAFIEDISQLAVIFLVVGLVFGAAVVANTTSTTLNEREVEHATLQAMGMRNGEIRRGLVTEMLVLAPVGAAMGVGLGLLTAGYLVDVLASELKASILLHVAPVTMAALAASMVVIALGALLLSSRRLGRIDLPAMVKELAR